MYKRQRVLVVDDSAFNRKAIKEMLETSPLIEVVGTAVDGEDAMKRVIELKPDVITLDLEMPKMDGFTFLRILMSNFPTPVIVISSRDEVRFVFKAMELGAVDFIAKPTHLASTDLYNVKDELLTKIAMASSMNIDAVKPSKAIEMGRLYTAKPFTGKKAVAFPFSVVLIGSSTGGPAALNTICAMIAADVPAAFAVSQHMPAGFTRSFADRLNRFSYIKVEEASHGSVLRQGRMLIAPGGYNMTFVHDGIDIKTHLTTGGTDKFVPSVDKMFLSGAELFGHLAVAVVLTGMGNDGKEGVKALKAKGAHIIAQSEETSVIFGMPKEAIATGSVDEVLPLNSIAPAIVTACKNEALKRQTESQ
ncbi:MAG: chemotaxis response regulator protein-glutamate methylesterase [Deltaproteobacteria bacterium]|nr:chemotaxis response regulator protein-glutamate methylesterase [Deltaproteobacteria bacterium]